MYGGTSQAPNFLRSGPKRGIGSLCSRPNQRLPGDTTNGGSSRDTNRLRTSGSFDPLLHSTPAEVDKLGEALDRVKHVFRRK